MAAQGPDSIEPDAQSEPLDTESPSAFQSLLRWIGRPGYAVRNVLKGNTMGALRQTGDFAMGLIDELPMGGLLPQFSKKEDYPEFSDVVGGMEPGLGKTATDVVGGLVTDPLTYLAAPVSVGARVAKGIQSAEAIAKATNAAQIARKVTAAANGGLDSAQVGADALQQASRPLIEDEVRKTLSQNLSGKGRLYERQTGNSAAEDVINQANGDKDQLMQLIQNDPRFQQGGLKLRVPILNRYIPGLESGTLFPGKNLDPLSQSLGAFSMVGGGIAKGMRNLGFGDTVDNLGKIGQSIKRAIQAEDLTPGEEDLLSQAQNSGQQSSQLATSRMGEIFKDVPVEQRQALFDVINNSQRKASGEFGEIDTNAQIDHPLVAAAKNQEDVAYSGTARATVPARDYLQIKKPSSYQSADELEAALGAEGVAIPKLQGDVLESVTKDPTLMGAMVFNPKNANQAAGKFLNQAFPPVPTDPRFANGIYLANQAHGIAQKAPTFGPESSLLPKQTLSDQSLIPKSLIDKAAQDQGGLPAEYVKPTLENLPQQTASMGYIEDQLANWNKRIDALDKTPEEKQALKELASKYIDATHQMYQENVRSGAMYHPPGYDITREMPVDYAPRQFSAVNPEEMENLVGTASANKDRVLRTSESLNQYRNAHPEIDLNTDLGEAALKRASQQGQMTQRAVLAKSLTGESFGNLTDPETRKLVSDNIADIAKVRPDFANRLKTMWEGMPQRGPVMQTIADLNKPFKQAAVMGIMVPRLGSIVGNRISKPFQAIAQQGAQDVTLANLHREPGNFLRDLSGAAVDGLHSMGIAQGVKSGDLGQAMDAYEAALKTARNPQQVTQMASANGGPLGPQYAQFRSLGGDDGFVSSEQLIGGLKGKASTFADKFGEFWKKPVLQWPAVVWKSVESRMRFGMYKDMVDAGMDPQTAVKNVSDSLYDYRVTSAENRTLRDIVPFAQFTIKAAKQQAPFVSRTPAVGAALGPVLGANPNDAPVPDYLQGQTHIPLGLDSQGNQKYIAGLRLPIETLNKIPYWGGDVGSLPKQIRQDVVSSMSPPIKTAYSYVSGEDPYFGSAFGSYDANPQVAQALGADKHSEAAKIYNMLSGTGAIQPVSSLVNTLNSVTDQRKDVSDRLLNTMTGAKVTSVDEDQALQQQLTEYLRGNPDVSQYTSFYSQDRNPKVEALTKQLGEIKKRIKAKRDASKTDSSTEIP